jgi:hypothetical protein
MTSFTHRPPINNISIPTIAPTTISTLTFIMSEPLKAGQTVSCVFAVAVEEARALNCEMTLMTGGNGVAAMSQEKLTKS